MMFIMLVLVVLGLGLVIYAIFEVFKPGKPEVLPKLRISDQPLATEDPGKDQKIQRLQSQIAKLETQVEQTKIDSVEGKSGAAAIKEKEAEFSIELKRREEWVAKAEAELAKIKAENLDLNNKFIAKEGELQEEFTKNVNLTREIRDIKSALEAKEMACRLKEDQLQVQRHQIESQLKSIDEHLATIAEFNRKEKISEWVPKSEFNQLNEEYTKLEKDLEASQERLKNFAVEITHLRQRTDKEEQSAPAEEVKPPEAAPDAAAEAKQVATIPEESKAIENIEIKGESIISEGNKAPEEVKPVDESEALEESKVVEEVKPVDESEALEESKVVEEVKPVDEGVVSEESKIIEETKLVDESIVLEESKIIEEIRIVDESVVPEENKAPEETKTQDEDKEKKTE
ncbi:MAG: hypothetical protein V1830_02280 [Candidatus Omnitrophota bacterium]